VNVAPGTRVGGYVVLEKLGEGGMGAVFKARDEKLGRVVALKLASRVLVEDERLRKRFVREARAAALARHRHVAVVHDVGEHQGLPFIVMELVAGGSLKDRLRKQGCLPWREVAVFGAQVARGLAAIHGLGLVHRDLKPENVLLDSEGVCKITDFGLVGITDETGLAMTRALTKTGEIMGTLVFMAPEQADGRKVGPEADLYSLGATLFALLAGRPPFEGQGIAVVKAILADAPPSLGPLAPGTPSRLLALVERLLSKEPSRRGEAAEVARELDAIAAGSVATGGSTKRLSIALGLGAGLVAVVVAVALAAFKAIASAAPPALTPPAPPVEASPTVGTPPPAVSSIVLEETYGSSAFIFPSALYGLAMSPDGRRVAACGLHCALLFDGATGKDVASLGSDTFFDAAFARDGRRLFLLRDSGELVSFDAESGSVAQRTPLGVHGTRIATSADGSVVVGTDDGSVVVVAPGGAKISFKAHANEIRGLDVSPDGKTLATACGDGEVGLWSLDGPGEPRKRYAKNPCEGYPEAQRAANGIRFAPDGASAVSVHESGVCEVWDPNGGAPEERPLVLGALRGVAFVSAESFVVLNDSGRAKCVGPDGPWEFVNPEYGQWAYPRIASAPAVRRVVMCGLVTILRTCDASGKETAIPGRVSSRPAGLAVTSDGKTVAAGYMDGGVRTIDLTSGRVHQLPERHASSVNGLALVGDGKRVATIAHGGDLIVQDLKGGAGLKRQAHDGPGRSLVRLPDGRFATAGQDGRVISWSAGLAQDVLFALEARSTQFGKRAPWIQGLGAGADARGRFELLVCSNELYFGSEAGFPLLAPAPTDDSYAIAAIAEDGVTGLAGTTKGRIEVWDLSKHQLLGTLDGQRGCISALGVVPGSRRAITASNDNTIRLWDLDSRRELSRFELTGSLDYVQTLAFVPGRAEVCFGTERGLVLRCALK
jgi:serine/threonine-protein kinase